MKSSNRIILFSIIVGFILWFLVLAFPRKDWRISRYTIHGIDISHYQEQVDFEQLKSSQSVDFVFVKATEGISIKDKRFKENWAALKANNVTRGAYHFYRPSVKAKQQAQEFIKTVQLSKGDLPPVLDVEETDNRSKAIILKGIKIWLKTIEAHYQVKPIIYVNQDFYINYIQDNFHDYTIWLAAYRRQRPDISEGDWSFWQYTDQGKTDGVVGNVDKNVFYGTREDFQKLLVP